MKVIPDVLQTYILSENFLCRYSGPLSRKLKIFIAVRIELAGSLDYLRLKEYPRIVFSLTVASIRDRLEVPVLLLLKIFYFAASAESLE